MQNCKSETNANTASKTILCLHKIVFAPKSPNDVLNTKHDLEYPISMFITFALSVLYTVAGCKILHCIITLILCQM